MVTNCLNRSMALLMILGLLGTMKDSSRKSSNLQQNRNWFGDSVYSQLVPVYPGTKEFVNLARTSCKIFKLQDLAKKLAKILQDLRRLANSIVPGWWERDRLQDDAGTDLFRDDDESISAKGRLVLLSTQQRGSLFGQRSRHRLISHQVRHPASSHQILGCG